LYLFQKSISLLVSDARDDVIDDDGVSLVEDEDLEDQGLIWPKFDPLLTLTFSVHYQIRIQQINIL